MNKRMQCLAVLLVTGMFAAAGFFGEKGLIFPEIAALACGAWVMPRPPWRFNAITVWLSPSLAALSGVLILKYLPAPPVCLICAGFLAVVLQLKIARSAVIPSLSAAILPIILRVETLWYALSVCVLTGLIALVHLARTSGRGRDASPTHHERTVAAPPRTELAKWGKLTAGVFAMSLVALRGDLLFMVAPPLIVTYVELSKTESALRQRLWHVLALLGAAALTGVAQLHLFHVVLHWPLWISAGVTTGTVFLLYQLFSLSFPPAAAIALLPTILPADRLWDYPWQVLLGSAAFIALSVLLFRRDEGIAQSAPSGGTLVPAHQPLPGEGEAVPPSARRKPHRVDQSRQHDAVHQRDPRQHEWDDRK